jgi:hypothetical protein
MSWLFLHHTKIPFLLLMGSLVIGGPIVIAILAATRRAPDDPGDGDRPRHLGRETSRDAA